MHIGTIAALWCYPVKSLAAQALAQAEVTASGFAGDRSTALMVTSAGHVREGKPYRGKEHGLLHTVATPHAAQTFAAAAGVAVAPITGEHFFDAQPISLVFDTWLHDVERLTGRTLDPLRYRPNIFAHATPDFTAREAELVGVAIAAGPVRLNVVAAIRRCVTTTYDIETGESDPAVLRDIAQHRGNIVGVYCTVARSGTIASGDSLESL